MCGEVVLYDVHSLFWWVSASLMADELQPWSPPLVHLLRNTQTLVVDVQAHVLIAYPLTPDMLRGHPGRVPFREYAHAAVRLEAHRTDFIGTEHNRRVVLPVRQPVYALLAINYRNRERMKRGKRFRDTQDGRRKHRKPLWKRH